MPPYVPAQPDDPGIMHFHDSLAIHNLNTRELLQKSIEDLCISWACIFQTIMTYRKVVLKLPTPEIGTWNTVFYRTEQKIDATVNSQNFISGSQLHELFKELLLCLFGLPTRHTENLPDPHEIRQIYLNHTAFTETLTKIAWYLELNIPEMKKNLDEMEAYYYTSDHSSHQSSDVHMHDSSDHLTALLFQLRNVAQI